MTTDNKIWEDVYIYVLNMRVGRDWKSQDDFLAIVCGNGYILWKKGALGFLRIMITSMAFLASSEAERKSIYRPS